MKIPEAEMSQVAMPWTDERYPAAMRRLPGFVREKAIAIANALLMDRYEEGRAIRIAIAQARRWALGPQRGSSPDKGRRVYG
jgi:uncharacterized protein YdaT